MSLKKRIILAISVIAVVVAGKYSFDFWKKSQTPIESVKQEIPEPQYGVIGTSVQGRKIESYTFGHGSTTLAFVGGIHGGYEWNSVFLAYKFIDYLSANKAAIPQNLTITVIPSANPDGVYKMIKKEGRFTVDDVPTGSMAQGRFNANKVDLNRNFDCNWQATSTWQSKTVSAGSAAFSEPEARAIRSFVLTNKPAGVIFWHSMSGTVYASQCNKGILPATLDIMNAYANASGYKTDKSFNNYSITGDAEGWLASINIPAITVELKTHDTIEWAGNLAGIKALFDYYGQTKNNPNLPS